ncbi:MAG: hypothetical protein Q7R49_00970 [Candidatus Daviesbacteria bacterium]|nr:hypothetical protein [Candidatus Daviesbacteria bacterium]
MKLLLLHGPATRASREKLLTIKQKFDETSVQIFDLSVTATQIANVTASISLLDEHRLIILENPEELPGQMNSDEALTLALWFDQELPEKNKILQFVKDNSGEIFYFPPEKELTIFPFLDLLASRSPQAFAEISKLQKTHEKFSDNQYLITMIFYLLRSLVVTPKTAPSFVKQKLEKQRKNFDSKDLVSLYGFVLETDYKIKTGLIDQTQAQFLLVNKFLKV